MPYARERFAWDEITHPHELLVEIENVRGRYEIDEIGDHRTMDLSEGNEMQLEREEGNNLTKGYLRRKGLHDDKYQEVYCVLSQRKQVLKVYEKSNPGKPQKIILAGSKIDDMRDQEFMIMAPKNKKEFEFFVFKASSEEEFQDWIRSIKRAVILSNPNLIFVKVEPIDSTKVVTFYTLKFDQADNSEMTILPQT